MTLTEALTLLKNQPVDGAPFELLLACGSTPLYLEKLLAAEIQQRLPERRVAVRTGLFGDLAGTLETVPGGTELQAVAVALEWPDLDPRLGYRQLGGWGPAQEADYANTIQRSCSRILAAIERLSGVAFVLSLPTLPLPPAFHTAGWEAGPARWEAERALADFARSLARLPNTRIASRERIAALSGGSGLDLKSELLTGLSYSTEHASAIAQVLARLIVPPAPKKGLITDLDDTLWRGIVGEVGPEAVSWDLAGHSQIHGLYQQLLRALGESGVLLGVASKNDPAVVEDAMRRADLLLPPGNIFPIEAHWQAKSGSVDRILTAWNISADAVVFIDDSPMELAEVAAAHPGITCLEFPRGNAEKALALFHSLRDLFGKHHIAAEDAYRLDSIRQAAEFQEISGERGSASEELLASLNANVIVDLDSSSGDARVLELVNKTNQFNLNGIRFSEADWRRSLEQPGAFVATVSYTDKFGPLGKIAVLHGRVAGRDLHIQTWVMSCRAFSRRIEQQSLATLFEQFEAQAVVFDFLPTNKNGPLREFLEQLLEREPEERAVRVDRAAFESKCPRLYHSRQVNKAEYGVRG